MALDLHSLELLFLCPNEWYNVQFFIQEDMFKWQVPWTAIGTVRDNITFGRDWDEKLYRKVYLAL